MSKELLVLVVPAMAGADLGVAGQPGMENSAFLVASGRITSHQMRDPVPIATSACFRPQRRNRARAHREVPTKFGLAGRWSGANGRFAECVTFQQRQSIDRGVTCP